MYLKIDIGMGCLGVRIKEELYEMMKIIVFYLGFVLDGVFIYFVIVDELNLFYFEE